jgi:hypothetical protein
VQKRNESFSTRKIKTVLARHSFVRIITPKRWIKTKEPTQEAPENLLFKKPWIQNLSPNLLTHFETTECCDFCHLILQNNEEMSENFNQKILRRK